MHAKMLWIHFHLIQDIETSLQVHGIDTQTPYLVHRYIKRSVMEQKSPSG